MVSLRALGLLAALAFTATAQDDDDEKTTKTTMSTSTRGAKPTETTTSDAEGATHTVTVGAFAHAFDPKELDAKVGDTIQFNFYPGAHRVARATFGWPCIPYEYVDTGKVGFYSGIIDPQVVSSNPPNYKVRVNDTQPIFFYCAAPGSCMDWKMIGVINPNSTQTLDAQLKFAEKAEIQLAPGDPFPTETPFAKATPTGNPDNNNSDGGGGGLSKGAIAGIAIGAAAVVILGAALLYLCGRRGGFDKAYRKSVVVPPSATAAAVPPSPPMVEAAYAHTSHNPKSPGQQSMSPYGGGDVYAGGSSPHGSPSPHPTPSPGPHGLGVGMGAAAPPPGYGPQYGQQYGHLHPQQQPYGYPPPQELYPSPQPNVHTPFIAPPVELPSEDVPTHPQSPPPGYRGSWLPGQEGQYKPGGKP